MVTAYGMWTGNDGGVTTAATAKVPFPTPALTPLGITQTGTDTFTLPSAGIYEISFQVPVVAAGNLVIWLQSGGEQVNTVVGRAAGTSQIVGFALLELAGSDDVSIRVPTGGGVVVTENDVVPIVTRPLTRCIIIKKIR